MTQRLKLGKKGHTPWRYRDGRKRKDEIVRLTEMDTQAKQHMQEIGD